MPTDPEQPARPSPDQASVCVIGSFAEALVLTADRLPRPGETVLGRDYRETFGGKGSDMAVQAARLGASVSFVGVIGDDAFGRGFVELMGREGVDTSHVRVTPERSTGVGVVIKDPEARNLIVVDPGANALFGRDDLEAGRDALAMAQVALTQLEIPLDTALCGMELGRELGLTTVLNPAPATDLRAIDLSGVDVVTPNETEARVAVGLPPDSEVSNEDIAGMLLERGAGAVVITMGARGADVFVAGVLEHVDAPAIAVVDSNGAGDSFNAALAVRLGEGASLVEAVRFATAVATLSCTKWETVPSYPDRVDVDAFLAQLTRLSAAGTGDADGGSL